jgi:CRISPR/Cas system CMR-associated protein Cmr1 (group 7 of RAMP superfamily)
MRSDDGWQWQAAGGIGARLRRRQGSLETLENELPTSVWDVARFKMKLGSLRTYLRG